MDISENNIGTWVVLGKFDRVSDFIKDGGDINIRPEGQTLLHWAVQEKWTDVTRLLLNNGAEVDGNSKFDKTPLSTACSDGNADIVRLLLEAGASVTDDIPDNFPLQDAAAWDHTDIVTILLCHSKTKGIELINTQDDDGNTALIYAAMYGHLEMTSLLMKNGADKKLRNEEGKDAYYYASKENDTELLEILNSLF